MSDTEIIGPALPPHLLPEKHKQTTNSEPSPVRVTSSTSPPECSRILSQCSGTSDSDNSSSDSENEQKTCTPNIIGPKIPREHGLFPSDQGASHSQQFMGPELPPNLRKCSFQDESDSDNGYGPQPPVPGQERVVSAADEFEERDRKRKYRLIHGTDDMNKVQHETWMTELPSGGLAKHMGLKARKLGDGFKVKDEDQSVWTDTPADRQRKAKEASEGRSEKRPHTVPVLSNRDRSMAEQVAGYNKNKRESSLLDMHAKKLSKKKKGEKKEKKKKDKKKKSKKSSDSDKPERRPFDRDTDLGFNKFDNAKRQALIKRSKELNTKFGHGGGQQFL